MKRFLIYLGITALLIPSVSFGAIAFDAAQPGNYFATLNGSTLSATVTTTANPIIFCAGFGNAPTPTDSITGFQINGLPFTKVGSKQTNSADGRYETLWYITSNAGIISGTHNISVSSTGGDGAFDCISYTGVAQTNPIDVIASSTTGSAATSLTTNLTTVTNNDWTISANRNEAGSSTGAPRVNDVNGNSIYDSGAAITPPGSTSLTVAAGSATAFATVMAAFKPAVSTTAKPTRCLIGSGRTTGCSRP